MTSSIRVLLDPRMRCDELSGYERFASAASAADAIPQQQSDREGRGEMDGQDDTDLEHDIADLRCVDRWLGLRLAE
jgi:hypothetical protein